jgi:putative membrane protein
MRYLWLAIFLTVFIWSAIDPKDVYIWIAEVLPAIIGLVLIIYFRRSFPLTPLLYGLILVHSIILMVGGHYTYAEVPLFDNLFGFERNNYDKLGHLAQGFIPAILAREILIRLDVVNGGRWRILFILSICLAFSALYELIEWLAAEIYGGPADAFLATQGYEWDTQSDMALALLGAILALLTLSRLHNRQLQRLRT